MNIVLIGLRCSGKTTVGRVLAARLARPFIDLDDLTRLRVGARSITDAFARFGETAFRLAEFRSLADALSGNNQVIALGGGTPTAPGAPDLLDAQRHAGAALTIYLRASETTLRDRLIRCNASDRPALTGDDPVAEVGTLLGVRDTLYTRLADAVIDVDALTIDAAADRVLAAIQSREQRSELSP